MGTTRTKLKAAERETFKKMLRARRAVLVGDVNHMQDNAFLRSTSASTGELSRVPYHMADVGTDNFEHEFILGLIENEEEELRQIDEALERLEKGSFGACENCGKAIPKSRLKVIPYAKLCIECKRDEENGG